MCFNCLRSESFPPKLLAELNILQKRHRCSYFLLPLSLIVAQTERASGDGSVTPYGKWSSASEIEQRPPRQIKLNLKAAYSFYPFPGIT